MNSATLFSTLTAPPDEDCPHTPIYIISRASKAIMRFLFMGTKLVIFFGEYTKKLLTLIEHFRHSLSWVEEFHPDWVPMRSKNARYSYEKGSTEQIYKRKISWFLLLCRQKGGLEREKIEFFRKKMNFYFVGKIKSATFASAFRGMTKKILIKDVKIFDRLRIKFLDKAQVAEW